MRGYRDLLTARHAVRFKEQVEIDNSKAAVELLTELPNDALRDMCRARRAVGSERKAEFVSRLMGTRSRANDSQMAQILRL